MYEREEQENATNFQPAHPWQFWPHIDENAIIPRMAFSPSWSHADVFTSHAAGPTGVTRSPKGC
jgi:hypothetical protein